MNDLNKYSAQRVRHELVGRLLSVVRSERIASNIVRITLTGDDLHGFTSASFDDHIKIFLPRNGEQTPFLPDLNNLKKRSDDESQRPIARDYTPRRYDAASNELDIEFVIHGDGPGSTWAEHAKPGDQLGIGGPRGSFVTSDAFDWYLLVGDETAIPAIGRRIEELPADASALVIVETSTPEGLPNWPTRSNVRVHPVYRGDAAPGTTDLLLQAVQAANLPDGVGHAWVAAESLAAKQIRQHLVEQCGFDKQHIRASSYWRHGDTGHHENIDD